MKPRIYKEAGQWWVVRLPSQFSENRHYDIVRFRTWAETIRFVGSWLRTSLTTKAKHENLSLADC